MTPGSFQEINLHNLLHLNTGVFESIKLSDRLGWRTPD